MDPAKIAKEINIIQKEETLHPLQAKMYRILSYEIIVKKKWEKTGLYHHVKCFILLMRVCEAGLRECELEDNEPWVLPTS